jgi:hypothetical protein
MLDKYIPHIRVLQQNRKQKLETELPEKGLGYYLCH